MNTVFTGSGVAIITPFCDKGIDFDKLGELIDYQIENKTDAIVICGTTGEASAMPDAEHKAAIEYAVSRTAGRVKVIAGTGSNDTLHCVELCKFAVSAGVDALLVVNPYYNKTSQHGLVEHYKYIAARVDNIPIILYNVPARTGLNVTPATMYELSKIDNIVGMKEASGNIAQVADMVRLCGDKIDFYSGNDEITVPVMSLGGKGVISVAANIAPRQVHDMCQLYLDGDVKGAAKIQLDLVELINALFIEVSPVPVKTAMNMLGMNVGPVRMPLFPMLDKNKEILKNALINAGFTLKEE